METKIAESQTATLVAERNESEEIKRKFSAGEFEGPLDLLWFLIHKSEINIYDIPIAQITEQYLEYLDYATQTDLGDLSEFYKWAAMLLNMKSKMLLPVEINYDDMDEIEDPRDELVEKLIDSSLIDYVAMDVKTRITDEDYKKICCRSIDTKIILCYNKDVSSGTPNYSRCSGFC